MGDDMGKDNIGRYVSIFLITAVLSVLVLSIFAPVNSAARGRIENNSTQSGLVGTHVSNTTVAASSTIPIGGTSPNTIATTNVTTTVAPVTTVLPTTVLPTSTVAASTSVQPAATTPGPSNTPLYVGVVIVIIIVLVAIWYVMKRKK
jgi:hypothetical protein